MSSAALLGMLCLPLSARGEPAEAVDLREADEAAAVTEPPSDPATTASSVTPNESRAPLPSEPPAQEISIVGTRLARTPGSAHVIRKSELERSDHDDAQAVLQKVPGVYVRQEDGIGLRPNIGIRGANADRSKKLTLMEDGILFGPAPYSAPAAYYFPLVTRMTAVRVIKGPAALAYGPQTVGGAVDFVTRPIPDRVTGAVMLAAGEYGYAKLHAHFGASDDRTGFLVEGVRLVNTGFKELPDGADTGSTRNDWIAKFRYVLDPAARERHELELKLTYADEVSNETYLGLTDADFRANPYRRYAASALDQMTNQRTAVLLSHRFTTPDSGLSLRTRAYRHDYARTWRKLNDFRGARVADVLRNPGDPAHANYLAVLRGEVDATPFSAETLLIGPNERTFVSQGIESVLSFRLDGPALAQRLELGVRLHHDEIRRRHSQDAFALIDGALVPEDVRTQVTTANEAQSDALALHFIDALTYGPLTVTPGMRVELIRSELDNELTGGHAGELVRAWMPGAGLYYAVTADLGVLAGVYRGFSPPPPPEPAQPSRDGSAADFREPPQPEYSVNYEAGVRFAPGQSRAELIGFFNDYSNLTDTCSFASGCLNANLDRQIDAGQARIYGLEAFAGHVLPLSAELGLPFTASYTFTRAVFDTSFDSIDPTYESVRAGDELPYVPRHQFAASAAVEHERGSLGASFQYVSAMREEPGSEPLSEALATDPQYWFDIDASARVTHVFTVSAHVRNLLNDAFIVSRRPYGARPNAPRWVQMALEAKLP